MVYLKCLSFQVPFLSDLVRSMNLLNIYYIWPNVWFVKPQYFPFELSHTRRERYLTDHLTNRNFKQHRTTRTRFVRLYQMQIYIRKSPSAIFRKNMDTFHLDQSVPQAQHIFNIISRRIPWSPSKSVSFLFDWTFRAFSCLPLPI